MKVLLFKAPGDMGEAEVPNTLPGMQAAVGGLVEVVQLDEPFVAIVNEEGAVKGLPVNGPFYGPWFICAVESGAKGIGEQFRGLTPEELTLLLAQGEKEEAPA